MMAENDRARPAGLIAYADFVCPYSWLAEVIHDELRAQGVALEMRPFELWPAPRRLPSAAVAYSVEMWERDVVPLAHSLGLSRMQRPQFVTRTRKAHEAAAHAGTHGRADDMRAALYRAWFEEGRDIGRIDVLVEIGAALGLHRGELKVALDVDKHAGAVVAAEAEATRSGIDRTPAYVAAGTGGPARVLPGLQTADALRALLATGTMAGSNGEME